MTNDENIFVWHLILLLSIYELGSKSTLVQNIAYGKILDLKNTINSMIIWCIIHFLPSLFSSYHLLPFPLHTNSSCSHCRSHTCYSPGQFPRNAQRSSQCSQHRGCLVWVGPKYMFWLLLILSHSHFPSSRSTSCVQVSPIKFALLLLSPLLLLEKIWPRK